MQAIIIGFLVIETELFMFSIFQDQLNARHKTSLTSVKQNVNNSVRQKGENERFSVPKKAENPLIFRFKAKL